VKLLYVTDRGAVGDEHFERVLAGLASRAVGGVLRVELREKETGDREVVAWAARAREILGPSVPLYVNRRFDLALAAGADGVHLPSDGLPVPRVRANTPRGFRIGVSTHAASEAAAAIDDGADLVVIGPIFPTPSKEGLGVPLGPEVLGALPPSESHAAEVFAIGGVTEENLEQLLPWRDRIAGVAGIRMFQDAPDPVKVLERIAAL
jgi:thiamine-phosphate pyrophosphorylase